MPFNNKKHIFQDSQAPYVAQRKRQCGGTSVESIGASQDKFSKMKERKRKKDNERERH